jgi:hypothetical protein
MANQKTIKTKEQEDTSDVSSNSAEEEALDEAGELEATESAEFRVPPAPNVKVRESLTDMVEYYTEMAFINPRERLDNMRAADVRTPT